MSFKKMNTVNVLIVLYALHSIGANFAHPITPSYINFLQLPSAMFGYIFAAMSFANFMFSPFWGVMSRYIKAKNLFLIGSLGYAVGQLIFGFIHNPYIIIFARVISGSFVAAIAVGAGYYVVQKSKPEEKSKNITKMMAVYSVSGTIGYFLGGYLGGFSLKFPFVVQVLTLVLVGVFAYVFLEDNDTLPEIDYDRVKSSSNPFVGSGHPIKFEYKLLFLIVFLISTASTSLTQTFSYYIVDALNMTSFTNGITKGMVGLISLGLNFTLTMRIINGKDVEKSTMGLFLVVALLVLPLIGFGTLAIMFTIMGVIVMSADTMPVSILQGRTVSYASDDTQGEMLGVHNAMKSLGMITGSLVAGWIYDLNYLSPFVLTMVLYLVSLGLMGIIRKYVKSS